MMYKTDGTEIEGKFGGVIFRHDQCGPHIQAYPRIIDKTPSQEQRIRRNAFDLLNNFWTLYSNKYTTDLWWYYAMEHPKKTSKGKVYFMEPRQAFFSYNINRVVSGLEPEIEPPFF
jgi:hypothetical protein